MQLICLTEKSIFDVSEEDWCDCATERAISDVSRESFVNAEENTDAGRVWRTHGITIYSCLDG
ncbi:hypothetical protein [Paenibacillus qinlingensis]|uniref:Uncharacterized protein n=1 Tax=Paenibacillus qinlingensis TaxID=1837343 RepID=A0ABU1NWT9_9BACL|nr:hypothetical protein [Paenibacillus qinlingensis]MDR6551943.1 hypothetical protein [Paenibacillus qinlingensis]